MKSLIKILWSVTVLCICTDKDSLAQGSIISTIAGNGLAGYSGDNGPATTAEVNYTDGIAIDQAGNVYTADANNNRVRKISPSGIITTVAGNGIAGFSGDGGPATASKLNFPRSIAIDYYGNIYISDRGNRRIRKIDSSGNISTIAGNGTLTYSSDYLPATNVGLTPNGIALDKSGCLYIVDNTGVVIRKINNSGIIYTIAGNGSDGFSGDGGPATAASISSTSSGIAVDHMGNVYLADAMDGVSHIRKIDTLGVINTIAGIGTDSLGDGGPALWANIPYIRGIGIDPIGNIYFADLYASRVRIIDANTGIVNTVAGTGIPGFSGDGGDPKLAKIDSPCGLAVDRFGQVYVSDVSNYRIRKFNTLSAFVSDSFSVFVNNFCNGLNFNVISNSFSAGNHVKTFFGNGLSLDTVISDNYNQGNAQFLESYNSSGVYSIKHILFDGLSPVDSISYSYKVDLCQTVQIGFFIDANLNCIFDSGDAWLLRPVLVEIDSNGVPIDTISAASGFYYSAFGNPGDIYAFHIIAAPIGLEVLCPIDSTILDTLTPGINVIKIFSLKCSSATPYDLGIFGSSRSGHHLQILNLFAYNQYCTPVEANVNLIFDSKYGYVSFAEPFPTSILGNNVNWNVGAVTGANSALEHIYVELDGGGLSPGDTVLTHWLITPTSGDADTVNNYCIIEDTVKGGFDPNEISVSPSGCISTGSVVSLKYTIQFENTGNDTAHNIYILDTLPQNVNFHSLRLLAISAPMNISRCNSNGFNIVKFEFPKINLLDSSHHGLCDGMVIFTIDIEGGLPDSTIIQNRAGIYFDDNSVVMTNKVENIVGCPSFVRNLPDLPILSISPNPARENLKIQFGDNEFKLITIYDVLGQPVMDLQQKERENELNIPIGGLNGGVYLIKFTSPNGDIVKRFVKL